MDNHNRKTDKLHRANFLLHLHGELEAMNHNEKNRKLKRVISEMLKNVSVKTVETEQYQQSPSSETSPKRTLQRDDFEPRKQRFDPIKMLHLIRDTRLNEHHPIHTARFLALFSNDADLKFVTHDWDESRGAFNHEEFLWSIWKRFENALRTPDFSGAPYSTLIKIFTFLFNEDPKKGWGYERITIGWSSIEITKWCRYNKGEFPDEMPLPQDKRKYTVRGKTKQYRFFGDLIQKFRKEIRFVNEGKHLFNFLNTEASNNGLYHDHQPVFEKSLNGLDFFIDVDKFGAGLKGVFDGMKKRLECPKIVFSGHRDAGKVILTIFQEGASIQRLSPEEDRIRPGTLGGDFENTRQNLFSQCDWTFEGPFQDGCAWAMHYLADSNQPDITPSHCTEGVRHTFTFYQPS